jgi:uncharacterized RDD family membrane protein YckC
MTQPSGWYDDPQDPSQLRYWDGVVWSSHVSPKVSPTVQQSTIGMPYGVTPAAARHQPSGPQNPPAVPGQSPSPQDQGQPGGQWPASGQGPGGAPQLGWQSHPATTPDGVALSGWWLRVLARLLDGIFTFLIALPLTGWFYYRYLSEAISWSRDVASRSESGAPPVFSFPPWDVLQYVFMAGLIYFVVAGVYEVYFLTRSGATPGKKIAGISVRARNEAGPPSTRAALIRTGVYYGLSLVSALANLLDVLWPLWDDKRQAIHDKAAATNVVVGPQPKREA